MKILYSFLLFSIFLTCHTKDNDNVIEYGTLEDPRDGQSYKTTEINGLIWMAENLNFETEDSWCYNDVSENCNVLGRLYTWDAAKNACPTGWRLPTRSEIEEIIDHYGGYNETYDKLITGGESGFNALFGGYYRPIVSDFSFIGTHGYYWTGTEFDSSNALFFEFSRNIDLHFGFFMGPLVKEKSHAYSCRCIQ